MSIRIGMTVTGLKELEASLRELGPRLAKSTMKRALLDAAAPMVSAMQSAAPSNRLRVRIVASGSLSKRQRSASRVRRIPTEVTVYVGSSPLRHAHLVEFGSGPRYNKAGAYRGTMPASPYVRPGFDASNREVLDRFGVAMGREVERAAMRLAKRRAKSALKINGGA